MASRCPYGFPSAIVSPGRLADGTPFPNFAWLTCPYLAEAVSAAESSGGAAAWAARARADAGLASALRATDVAVRAARVRESGGEDPCADVGLAGQKDPVGVKCLHAHVALTLVGIADPIGDEELSKIPVACGDARCMAYME